MVDQSLGGLMPTLVPALDEQAARPHFLELGQSTPIVVRRAGDAGDAGDAGVARQVSQRLPQVPD
jgi:hypothetical protein